MKIGAKHKIYRFDSSNENWVHSHSEANVYFLQSMQVHASDILRAKGYLTLNSVLTMLGMEESELGALSGWVVGDETVFVDFDLLRYGSIENNAEHICLHFNVNSTNVFRDKSGTEENKS